MPARRHVMLLRFLTVTLMVLALLPATAAPGGADSPEERRLTETKAKIAAVREQIEATKAERDVDAQSLAEAQAQVGVILEAVGEAELAVQRQQESVDRAGAELDRLEAEGRHQREVTSGRAVELYRQGGGMPLAAILSADSTGQALQRSTFVDVLSRADREAFELVEIAQVAIAAQRETLEAEQATLERVLDDQRQILAEADALRQERALVAAASETELANLHAEEHHLESESRELAALARRASLEQAAAAAARSAGSSGSTASSGGGASAAPSGGGGWTWPAGGAVTSGFGQRYGRMHEGIDIGASTGAGVVAANSGVVTFAGRMGGYGNLVLVDHGAGIVTAYAHLSSFSVSPGASVGSGQRLGAVGCTGSCTGPHLHFEVRVNGTARNPMNYL